jgi:HlyD family secretion protein
MKRRMFVVLLVAGIGAASWMYGSDSDAAAPVVRTAPVTRGSIVAAVQATGTVEPVTTVTVGSQVSGTIAWLGADFNSVVRKGDVIARLDDSLLQAQLEQAQANLTRVRADVEQRTMSLADAETKLARAAELASNGLISQTELEAARLAVKMAQTSLVSTRAQVTQAEAAVNQARVNLNHAAIRAPIDGVVIQRSVDVGQTVAASLSSPTIFLIAADLTRMQVKAGVDESDISAVRPGQRVMVRVDAYPRDTFAGTVAQVRLQPTVVSNVTTYPVVVDVANDEQKLKPGLTASATIVVDSRDDVLRVPNAALRYRPTAETFAAFEQPAPPAASGRLSAKVWVLGKDGLREVQLRVGLADGSNTEVLEGDLEPGVELVTSVVLPDAAAPAASGQPSTNIFVPQRPQGGRGR